MFRFRTLACSFCGKGAAEVSKLVAGSAAYICDACVAEANRIMSTAGEGTAHRATSRSLWTRLIERFSKRLARMQLRAA